MTVDEFIAGIQVEMPGTPVAEIYNIFNRLDLDRSYTLSKKEFMMIMME
jgi:hypothetical protein